MTDSDIDRRAFFRLDDQIHLIKTTLERHMLSDDPYEDRFRIPREAQLISQLRAIEAESYSLIGPILETNRPVAAYLKAIDQKIELISRYLITDTTHEELLRKEPVSISEGGITFFSDRPSEIGDFMHLTMILFPSYSSISAIGEVRTIQLPEHRTGQYRIGVEYSILLETDRKQLARYIRRKQSQLLRERNDSATGPVSIEEDSDPA